MNPKISELTIFPIYKYNNYKTPFYPNFRYYYYLNILKLGEI